MKSKSHQEAIMSPTKLIAITGPDGSGKSTLCSELKERLSYFYGESEVVIVSIWDGIEHNQLFCSKEEATAFLATLKGHTRTLFMFHAMSLAIDMARQTAPNIIIVDGYWYKYAVSEIGFSVEKETVLSAAAGFEKPDLTFYLDLSLEDRTARKKHFSRYETGTSGQTSGQEAEAKFKKYQQTQAQMWQELESIQGPWIHLDSNLSTEKLSIEAYNRILPEFKKEAVDRETSYQHS